MGLPETFFDWTGFILRNYGAAMLRGAGNTLLIAFIGTAVGCLIGLIVGIINTIPIEKSNSVKRKVSLRFVRFILSVYVEVFRGTPMMVQAAFIYFGLLSFGVNIDILTAGLLVVSINTGAYMAETVRGGILSIDPGQTEGAKAIGMTHYQSMTSVILPQAVRNIMPQIGNNLIINIKDTCVLSIIGVFELMLASRSAAGASYRFFEVYAITMVMYLAMTLFFSRLLRYIEKKMDGSASYDLATHDTLAHTSGMVSYREEKGGR